MFLLQMSVGDGCSWSAEIFIGVFTTQEKADDAILTYLDPESGLLDPVYGVITIDDFFTTPIVIDEILIG